MRKLKNYVKVKLNVGKEFKKLKIRCQNNFHWGFVNIKPLLLTRRASLSQSY